MREPQGGERCRQPELALHVIMAERPDDSVDGEGKVGHGHPRHGEVLRIDRTQHTRAGKGEQGCGAGGPAVAGSEPSACKVDRKHTAESAEHNGCVLKLDEVETLPGDSVNCRGKVLVVRGDAQRIDRAIERVVRLANEYGEVTGPDRGHEIGQDVDRPVSVAGAEQLVGQEGVEEKEPSDDQASPACGLRPEEIPPATLMRAEMGGWVIPVYGRRDLSPVVGWLRGDLVGALRSKAFPPREVAETATWTEGPTPSSRWSFMVCNRL
jgi:hypothetical protein